MKLSAEALQANLRRTPSPRRAAHSGVPVEVFGTDEHRLGLKPVLRSVWAPKRQRPIANGHHRFQRLYVTAIVGSATGKTVWCLSDGVSKPPFADLLDSFAEEVGAGPNKRVVLLLDNAGLHTHRGFAAPDRLRLVYLPSYNPEPQPAKTLWTLVDEPVVTGSSPTWTHRRTSSASDPPTHHLSGRHQITNKLRLVA